MAFTITGKIGGTLRSVTWDAGELTGDPEAIALAEQCAERWEGQWVGPFSGPWTETNHLCSAPSAYLLIDMIFDQVLDVASDAAPPGALEHLRRP